jgi:ABC-type Fe3+/spermidine/putrescine transport system ATPase subunit
MRGELADLHKRLGITFVYVTHDQAEAMVLGDRIVLMNAGRMIQQGKPEELYESPKNRFAASFIGTSNIFSGRLEGNSSNGQVQIRTDFGSVAVAKQIENAAPSGEETFFCVRPEWVRFYRSPSESGVNIYKVKIVKRQYYGKYIQYTVDLKGREIIVEAAYDWDVPLDTEVSLELPPERCVCLESD